MSHITKQKHTRLKGFTLIEMIVVVAIIGVLLGVFVPTIGAYMRRSRLKSANASAKLIFNSIQTICQEMEFSERGDDVTTFYGGVTGTDIHGTVVTTPITDGALTLYSINGTATANVWLDSDDDGDVDTQAEESHRNNLTATLNDNSTRSSFMNRMDRLYADNNETTWVAYISGFQVQAVICADEASTRYVGAYPINTSEDFSTVTEDLLGEDNDYGSIAELMGDMNAFQNIKTGFVDPAWDDN